MILFIKFIAISVFCSNLNIIVKYKYIDKKICIPSYKLLK